ncbi:MAG: ATPase domain-containing protein [Acidobacteriaceae bacterium]
MEEKTLKTESAPGELDFVQTGVTGLDDILYGGLPRNHLYLITGDPGTGKTTVAMQFLLEGILQGERGLYVTLSESKRELEQVAVSHGWLIDQIPIFEMTPVVDDLGPEAQYTVFHPADVELADTMGSILRRVDEIQPARVVFDSLSELRMLARDALRYRRQILSLKRHFAGRACTVLLLDDRTAEGNDLQLQSIAHGVIMLQSLDRDFGIKRRRIEIRKMRGAKFREGFHDFNIQTGGAVVYPRLVSAEHKPVLRHHLVSSGLAELDQLFDGGIDAGTTTLLMGPAGCGKSTIAARYAVSTAERGEHAAIFSFDESSSTFLKRCKGLGMDLQPHVEDGRIAIQQIDPAEMSAGEFVHQVRDCVENDSAAVVVIDSLNGFINAMPGEQFLMLQLHEMLSYLNQMGVATLFTMAQSGFLGAQMTSPIDVSYLADTVLLFRYFEQAGQVKQALSIVKKRSGSHERSIRELTFSENSLKVGAPLVQFEGILTGNPRFVGKTPDLEIFGANTQNRA